MNEYNEVIENAKASWRRMEITTDDLFSICRRAAKDAAMENDPSIADPAEVTEEPIHA